MDHQDNQRKDQQDHKDDQDQRTTRPFISSFSSLGTIESESESENSDEGLNNFNREDYEFFESSAFDSELGFLEEQYSEENDNDDDYEDMDEDDDDDDEEDELDVDELTYEELIALGEFIGVEQRGLSSDQISDCLRPIKVHQSLPCNGGAVDRCVICQMEYESGDDGGDNLVKLIQCEHSYHKDCITKWLHIKKSCPICSSEVSSSSTSHSSTATNSNKDLS